MTYSETVAYLYAQLPMYQRIGAAAYKTDLTNTIALLDLLGHPEIGMRFVHVAGTNGKGSTCHMIASILQLCGLKVGMHTSPHLKDMRERFRIDGKMVAEEDVIDFVERFRTEFEQVNASFFEWGVTFAFMWFKAQQVDIAVLETGMGGRLDSTNVVLPEVSVITNVGMDHMEFLGNDIAAIAKEKAGIIKAGVPVVIGPNTDAVIQVCLKRAHELGSPAIVVDPNEDLPYALDLIGRHQENNARTALSAVHVLKEKRWPITEEAIRNGLGNVVRNTGLQGRWQVLNERPMCVVDVAHNADGLRAVKQQLDRTTFKRLHVVLGTVNDKDITRILAELPQKATYYFCKADIPRGLPVKDLKAMAQAAGLKGDSYASVSAAYAHARQCAEADDLVLVTGSVFVVAEVL